MPPAIPKLGSSKLGVLPLRTGVDLDNGAPPAAVDLTPRGTAASDVERPTLICRLGRGSYGTVWSAERGGEKLAVKIISMPVGSEAERVKAEMLKEIELMRAFTHAHVVGFRGAFHATSSGEMWLVMEHCEAGSLLDVARATADGRLADADACAALRDSATGLAYLHSQKAIHRDVKAANLLLAADGAVKLADFGVSALSDAPLARAATVIGTPHGMAPEVIEGAAPYDARADVWSLGITAIELVKGRPPHIELSALLAMYTIVNEEAPSLDAAAHDAALATFVSRCLEKSPAERATCAQLLEEAPLPADRPRLCVLADAAIATAAAAAAAADARGDSAAADEEASRGVEAWLSSTMKLDHGSGGGSASSSAYSGTVVRHPSPSGTFVRHASSDGTISPPSGSTSAAETLTGGDTLSLDDRLALAGGTARPPMIGDTLPSGGGGTLPLSLAAKAAELDALTTEVTAGDTLRLSPSSAAPSPPPPPRRRRRPRHSLGR